MPEYSSTRGGAGFTVNTTYNPTTETVTTVVTAPNGSTATATTQRFVSEGGFTAAFPDLVAQLQASGALPAGATPPRNLYTAVGDSTKDVIRQADNAERAATATKTPVPDAPAPPPSTNNATDPAVAPAPNNTPAVESPSPPAAIPISSDPAQQQQANRNIAETIKYDGGVTTVSPVNDPSQRAQAQQDAIAAEKPATPSQFEDPAQRGAAFREAIENPSPVSPSNIVDPAQRQQNEIIQSEFPAKISNVQDPAQRAQAQQTEIEFADSGPKTAANPLGKDPAQRAQGLTAAKLNTQSQKTQQDSTNFKAQEDWRVRLSLAPGADYLYKVADGKAGILNPLQATNGVIFPYTPSISVQYNSTYENTDLVHTNYKFLSYKNSAVDQVTLTCDFTAQDTAEANYLLAVIHFFRSVTKMFYGKDQNPTAGVPPPLCYLSGLGAFQFDWHPLVVTNFSYALPTEVDYIRAGSSASPPGANTGASESKGSPDQSNAETRRLGGKVAPGALAPAPVFANNLSKNPITYIPTKMQLTIQATPIVTRNEVSSKFSLKEYATGALLRGSQLNSGGFW